MLVIALSALAGAASALVIGYAVHRFTHWPGSGFLYREHMVHHQHLYPPERFTSAGYVSIGQHRLQWVFLALWLLLAAASLGLLPLGGAIAAVTASAIFGGLHVPLHDVTHVRPARDGSWEARLSYRLGRLFPRWMRRRRRLHYIHHVDMGTNFGIYSFALDRLFGTFRDLA